MLEQGDGGICFQVSATTTRKQNDTTLPKHEQMSITIMTDSGSNIVFFIHVKLL